MVHGPFDANDSAGSEGLSGTNQRAKVPWILNRRGNHHQRSPSIEQRLQMMLGYLNQRCDSLWMLG